MIPSGSCYPDSTMSRSPKSDRSLTRLFVLTLSCAATAVFYAGLGAFITGFSLGITGFLIAATIGAMGGLVLSAIT